MAKSEFVSNRYYTIAAKSTGRVLEVADFDLENAAQSSCGTAPRGESQQWKILDAGDGFYKLICRHSEKAIDITVGRHAGRAHGSTSGILSAQTTSCGRSSRPVTAITRSSPKSAESVWTS